MTIALVLSFLGGLLNRWRGGWDGLHLSHSLKKAITALVPTFALHYPFFYITGFSWSMLVSWGLFWGLGLSPGWGSWMFVGRAEDSWKHNPDAIWVEWLALKRFGRIWIPQFHGLSSHAEYLRYNGRFNYQDSPTGQVRPFEWRKRMETFAMSMRGLGFTVPAPLIFYFYLLETVGHFPLLLLIFPLGLLMGFCYNFAFMIDKKGEPFGIISPNIGEIMTGFLILGGPLYLLSEFATTLYFN